jgi:hypothetical protein
MKRLTIVYDNTVLFDGEVEELGWQDGSSQVSVIGKLKRQAAPASGSGLMDLLTGVSKARTAETVRERKRELAAEREEAVREAAEDYTQAVVAHEEATDE